MDRVCKKNVHETQFVTLKSSGMTFVKGHNCRIFAAVIGNDDLQTLQKSIKNNNLQKMIWQDKLQRHDPEHKLKFANNDPHIITCILFVFFFSFEQFYQASLPLIQPGMVGQDDSMISITVHWPQGVSASYVLWLPPPLLAGPLPACSLVVQSQTYTPPHSS